MQIPTSISANLRFLVAEVDAQLERLQAFLAAPSGAAARHLLDRKGYALNLKMRIHESCLRGLARREVRDQDPAALRGVESIATELERIAGLCRDCVRQCNQLDDPGCLDPDRYTPMLERIRRGIGLVEPAIEANDTRRALRISEIENKLDQDCRKITKRYVDALKHSRRPADLVRSLFVAHAVEEMGDALLEISEAIISANLGQAVDLQRYRSLQASVASLESDQAVDYQIERIADTRSGSTIAGIAAAKGAQDDYVAVFKDGTKNKLKEERQGVRNWHEIYPGLAPRILAYKKKGRSAALLIEHLPGLTFEQILLQESPALLRESLKQLTRTLRSVWRETRIDEVSAADYTGQLQQRLDDVYRIHPEFRVGDVDICGQRVESFDRLLARAARYEKRLETPFAVYIHGDFNVDNIIYDPETRRINFIDLHRSRYLDYVQDVSVFMVSNYRLQILDAPLRQRIMRLVQDFYRITRRFAAKNDDASFDLRLALGLARSFASSTRFILDKSLARSMFLRARYLIEQVLAADPARPQAYRLPVGEIFSA